MDKILGERGRFFIRRFFGAIAFFLFIILSFLYFIPADNLPENFSAWLQNISIYLPEGRAVFLLSLFFYLFLFMAECFYRSLKFTGLLSGFPEFALKPLSSDSPPFLLSAIILETKEDVASGLIRSSPGKEIFSRAGVNWREAWEFEKARKNFPSSGNFSAPLPLSLPSYLGALYDFDPDFAHFLSEKGVAKNDFIGAGRFVQKIRFLEKKYERKWSKDNLQKIGSIGEDWAFGGAYRLRKYGKELGGNPLSLDEASYGAKEAKELVAVLGKSREANALIVYPPGSPVLRILFHLKKKIAEGTVSQSLLHKEVMIFDGSFFAEETKNKSLFESELLKILREAEESGNIILVMPNFGEFLGNGQSLGADVFGIMDPFLASPDLQVVALSNEEIFHGSLGGNGKIMSRFEKIMGGSGGREETEDMLFEEALKEEARNGVFFAYSAVRGALEGAERYFSEGEVFDKATDILLESASSAKGGGKEIISKEDIMLSIQGKTGIPTSLAEGKEKEKLLHLEEMLQKRVIGQDEALSAISMAMRRARSGVGNPNRPIGSFLFLGPTGVGKTETAKALSQIFFGDEKAVERIDMSEYRTADSLERLIGSFGVGKPGVLSSAIRDKNYGILLLDEFEKTTVEVRNLFLQVLDEGFFSDMGGKRVNVRNFIIIATSNAGSDLMWYFMKQGISIESKRAEIIDDSIKQGLFRPELLNRFDSVIIFHPISEETLRKIALLKLNSLAERLKEKGIEFIPNGALADFLARFGSDPLFGARPMNRAIAEKVEQKIADKLLRGEITAGARVEITPQELISNSPNF